MDGCEFVVAAQRYQRHRDHRHRCRIGSEALTQQRQIGQPPASSSASMSRQLSLAAASGQRQQLGRQPCTTLVADALMQGLEGACIGRTREQLITVDQVVERHRLLAQGRDTCR